MPETNTAAETKPKTTRTRRTKRKIVEDHARSYFDAVAARDPEQMAKHWSDDIVEDLPGVGMLRGPTAIKGFFREMFAALPDLEMTAERIVADDSRAAVEWRLRGTFSGAPYQGIEPNGRHIELRGLDLLEIEKQKITNNTVFFDTSEFARQIGMLPPMDSGAERAMKGAFNTVTKLRRAVNERMGS
jgi:steroid delta-isomerase-like uncharacterized protein